ncbi:MAG: hypothetical protein ACLFPE_13620, partial [Bacteroidales bacterium]
MKTSVPFSARFIRFLLYNFCSVCLVIPGYAQFISPSSTNDHTRNGLPPGWEYQSNTTNPHGIIVVLDANPRINNIPINPGDYIGAFYTDDFGDLKCGGADVWLGNANIIFPAY